MVANTIPDRDGGLRRRTSSQP